MVSRDIHETIIESNHRLTYNYVAEVLDKKIVSEKVPSDLLYLIQTSEELKLILDKRRKNEGKIDFDLPEIKLTLDKS